MGLKEKRQQGTHPVVFFSSKKLNQFIHFDYKYEISHITADCNSFLSSDRNKPNKNNRFFTTKTAAYCGRKKPEREE